MCKECQCCKEKEVKKEIQGLDILATIILGLIGFGSLLTLLVVAVVTTLL